MTIFQIPGKWSGEYLIVLDSPVSGETGFAFHGAGKQGNDEGEITAKARNEEGSEERFQNRAAKDDRKEILSEFLRGKNMKDYGGEAQSY